MMKDVHPEQKPNPPGYFSFILRCWTGDDGQVHARLIDIRTGVEYAVGDLAHLPNLVIDVLTNVAKAENEAQHHASEKLGHMH